jgi:hypothetical protein
MPGDVLIPWDAREGRSIAVLRASTESMGMPGLEAVPVGGLEAGQIQMGKGLLEPSVIAEERTRDVAGEKAALRKALVAVVDEHEGRALIAEEGQRESHGAPPLGTIDEDDVSSLHEAGESGDGVSVPEVDVRKITAASRCHGRVLPVLVSFDAHDGDVGEQEAEEVGALASSAAGFDDASGSMRPHRGAQEQHFAEQNPPRLEGNVTHEGLECVLAKGGFDQGHIEGEAR